MARHKKEPGAIILPPAQVKIIFSSVCFALYAYQPNLCRYSIEVMNALTISAEA